MKLEILEHTAHEMGEPNAWSIRASPKARFQARKNFKAGVVQRSAHWKLPRDCRSSKFQSTELVEGLFGLNLVDKGVVFV